MNVSYDFEILEVNHYSHTVIAGSEEEAERLVREFTDGNMLAQLPGGEFDGGWTSIKRVESLDTGKNVGWVAVKEKHPSDWAVYHAHQADDELKRRFDGG